MSNETESAEASGEGGPEFEQDLNSSGQEEFELQSPPGPPPGSLEAEVAECQKRAKGDAAYARNRDAKRERSRRIREAHIGQLPLGKGQPTPPPPKEVTIARIQQMLREQQKRRGGNK